MYVRYDSTEQTKGKVETNEKLQNYKKLFQGFFSQNVREKKTYFSLLEKISNYPKYLWNWNNHDLNNFLLTMKTISPHSINKIVQQVRDLQRYACNKLGMSCQPLQLLYDQLGYIDLEALLEVTISEREYRALRNLLIEQLPDGRESNYRDVVILELAWHLLTTSEIKYLKVSDIKEEDGRIQLNLKNRVVTISDPMVVSDIKKAIGESEYFVPDRSGLGKANKVMRLKDSPYLIRPVETRAGRSETCSNPSDMLRRVFEGLNVEFYGINLAGLTVEAINRSRKIELLKRIDIKVEDIMRMTGRRSDADLYWLKEIAKIIKEMENEKEGIST